MTTFASIEEISEYLEDAPDYQIAVSTRGGDFYLIFGAEDCDAYQGVPFEIEDGGTDPNVGDLAQFPGSFPVTLLTAPESVDSGQSER